LPNPGAIKKPKKEGMRGYRGPPRSVQHQRKKSANVQRSQDIRKRREAAIITPERARSRARKGRGGKTATQTGFRTTRYFHDIGVPFQPTGGSRIRKGGGKERVMGKKDQKKRQSFPGTRPGTTFLEFSEKIERAKKEKRPESEARNEGPKPHRLKKKKKKQEDTGRVPIGLTKREKTPKKERNRTPQKMAAAGREKGLVGETEGRRDGNREGGRSVALWKAINSPPPTRGGSVGKGGRGERNNEKRRPLKISTVREVSKCEEQWIAPGGPCAPGKSQLLANTKQIRTAQSTRKISPCQSEYSEKTQESPA